MSDIIVKKGSVEAKVSDRALSKYIENGWEVVEEKPLKKEKSTLTQYTKSQLVDIAKENNVNIKPEMKKRDIIDKIEYNKTPVTTTSNQGFTDNLIKE